MTVKIRMEAADVADLDAHEAALRTVLDIPESGSRDYRNRRSRRTAAAGDEDAEPGRRRYLESVGVRTTPAAAEASPAGRAPLAAAEDAKHRRDLAAEISVLTSADAALRAQPWAPLQPGDVVLSYLPADGHMSAYGSTYLAVDGETDTAGNAMLREVSVTALTFDDDDEDPTEKPEYLLRFDQDAGRWAMDMRVSGGEFVPWRDAPELTDASAVAGARVWAVQHLGELVDDPDRLSYLEWRPHQDGWTPVFVDAEPPAGKELTAFYDRGSSPAPVSWSSSAAARWCTAYRSGPRRPRSVPPPTGRGSDRGVHRA